MIFAGPDSIASCPGMVFNRGISKGKGNEMHKVFISTGHLNIELPVSGVLYTVYPIFKLSRKMLSMPINAYALYEDAQRKADRQEFWKAQGEILGNMVN